MVKNTIISANKANSLFWLGRYEERVYITLHLMRKCYDKMIDGEMEDYRPFWQKLDPFGVYQTNEEFTLGMMYDDGNPSSVMSAQRLLNHKALYIMMIGRNIENLDMLLRFEYSYERIAQAYDSVKHYSRLLPGLLDNHIECQLDSLIIREKYDLNDLDYKNKLLAFVNQLVRV